MAATLHHYGLNISIQKVPIIYSTGVDFVYGLVIKSRNCLRTCSRDGTDVTVQYFSAAPTFWHAELNVTISRLNYEHMFAYNKSTICEGRCFYDDNTEEA